jgi:menaquinone reductase, molybdopterin-binding-like subunit
MDWDRRAFVKFAVGAIGGLQFSPLLWKLTDDVAIWTQNWNWVPVPEHGDLAKAATYNPLTGSALKVRMVKGRLSGQRLIKVDGNEEWPLGAEIGGIIPQDASALQSVYYGDVRVKAPMLLDRKTGIYQRLSWDQAMALVAEKMGELKKAGKAHTVMALGADPDSAAGQMLNIIMTAYGSPNLAFLPRAADTLALAGKLMFGNSDIGFDLANARNVVSFGTPLLEGFGAPVATRAAFVAWREDGGALTQVEPRASITASQADTWLACKPGSEGMVALAMAAHILEKGLAVSGAFTGEAQFKSLVLSKYSPDKVAHSAGVNAAKLKEIAEKFAKADKAVAVCGPGQGGEPGRLFDFLAVLALNAVAGKVGKPGGLISRAALGLKPLGEAAAAFDGPPLAGGTNLPYGGYNAAAMTESALAGKPYKPGMLIVAESNPAFNGPQASRMEDLARECPFVVAFTPFTDESANLADLVLPTATFLECWGDCTTPYGLGLATYGLHRPLITTQPQAKGLADALLLLAKALGGPVADLLAYENAEAALKARAEGLGDFAELAERGWWLQDKPVYGQMAVDLQPGLLAKEPEIAGAHDHGLVLAAVPSMRAVNSAAPITPYMIKVVDDISLANMDKLVAEINPETAHHLHLHEGDLATVQTKWGGGACRVHLFHGTPPGLVSVPAGLGHTAFGIYLKGKGLNYNRMVDVTADPVTGWPVWGITPVQVRKV